MVRLLQSRCRQTLSNVHLLLFTMPLSSIRLQQLTKLTKHVNSLFDCKPNQLFKFFSIFWLKIIFLKRKTKKKQQKTEIYVHVALSQIFPEIFRSLETFQAIVFFSYFCYEERIRGVSSIQTQYLAPCWPNVKLCPVPQNFETWLKGKNNRIVYICIVSDKFHYHYESLLFSYLSAFGTSSREKNLKM